MTFELNIDKFLNTYWEHRVSDDVSVQARSCTRRGDDYRAHPIAAIRCHSLHSGCTAEEAMAYAQALTEAAFIVKTIEGQYPQIAARYDFQQKKREMRRERRRVEPKPERKRPVITEERAKALLAEIKRTNGTNDEGWRLAKVFVSVKRDGEWVQRWRIDSYDRTLDVSRCGGWRHTEISQKRFCEELDGSKIGDIRVMRYEYKTGDDCLQERKVQMGV